MAEEVKRMQAIHEKQAAQQREFLKKQKMKMRGELHEMEEQRKQEEQMRNEYYRQAKMKFDRVKDHRKTKRSAERDKSK